MSEPAEDTGVSLDPVATGAPEKRELPAAALRALAEAEARRAARERDAGGRPNEINGPNGPEPTRYGDWEKGGIASDF